MVGQWQLNELDLGLRGRGQWVWVLLGLDEKALASGLIERDGTYWL